MDPTTKYAARLQEELPNSKPHHLETRLAYSPSWEHSPASGLHGFVREALKNNRTPNTLLVKSTAPKGPQTAILRLSMAERLHHLPARTAGQESNAADIWRLPYATPIVLGEKPKERAYKPNLTSTYTEAQKAILDREAAYYRVRCRMAREREAALPKAPPKVRHSAPCQGRVKSAPWITIPEEALTTYVAPPGEPMSLDDCRAFWAKCPILPKEDLSPPLMETSKKFFLAGDSPIPCVPTMAPKSPPKRPPRKWEFVPPAARSSCSSEGLGEALLWDAVMESLHRDSPISTDRHLLRYQALGPPPPTNLGGDIAPHLQGLLGAPLTIQMEGNYFSTLCNYHASLPDWNSPTAIEGYLNVNINGAAKTTLGSIWLSTTNFLSQTPECVMNQALHLMTPVSHKLCAAEHFLEISEDKKFDLYRDCCLIQTALTVWTSHGPLLPNEVLKKFEALPDSLRIFPNILRRTTLTLEPYSIAPMSATFEDCGKLLDSLKPINLARYVTEILMAPTISSKVSALISILELYGVFWSIDCTVISKFFTELLTLFQNCLESGKQKYQLFQDLVFAPAEDVFYDASDELHPQADEPSVEISDLGDPTPEAPKQYSPVCTSKYSTYKPIVNQLSHAYIPKTIEEKRFLEQWHLKHTIKPRGIDLKGQLLHLFDNFKYFSIGAYKLITYFIQDTQLSIKEDPFLLTLMTGFLSLVFLLVPGLRGFNASRKSSLTLMDRLAGSFQAIASAEKASTAFVKFWESTTKFVHGIFGISGDPALDQFKDRLISSNTEMEQLLHAAKTDPGLFINSSGEMQKIKDSFNKNSDLLKTLTQLSSKPGVTQVLQPIWAQYNFTYRQLTDFYNSELCITDIKQVPVVVWIYGATCIGKSHMINTIKRQLSEFMGKEMKSWTRSKGVEYWNGYCGQDIVIFDDFMSITDGTCMDDADLMNIVTNQAYNVNIAEIGNKKMQFTSQFVIIFSNYATTPVNSRVACREALERRRDFLVYCELPGHDSSHDPSICGCFPPRPTGDQDWNWSRHSFLRLPKIVSAHASDEGMRDQMDKVWIVSDQSKHAFLGRNRIGHIMDETSNRDVWSKRKEIFDDAVRTKRIGDSTTLDEIVAAAAMRATEEQQIFREEVARVKAVRDGLLQRALEIEELKKAESMNTMKPQAIDGLKWTGGVKPIILLKGPGGTGKTTILQQCLPGENFFDFEEVKDQIDEHHPEIWFKNNQKLYISDLSSLSDSDLKKIGILIMKVYDLHNKNFKIALCANEPSFLQCASLCNLEPATLQRRCTLFDFNWKMIEQRGFGSIKFGGRRANVQDMQNIHNQNHSFSQLVKITSPDLDLDFTDTTLSSWIRDCWTPTTSGAQVDCFPKKVDTYDATNVFNINIAIEDMIALVNKPNALGPVGVAAKLLPHVSSEPKNELSVHSALRLMQDVFPKIKTTNVHLTGWRDWAFIGASDGIFGPLADNKIKFHFTDIEVGFKYYDTDLGKKALAVHIERDPIIQYQLDLGEECRQLVGAHLLDSLFINRMPYSIRICLDSLLLLGKVLLAVSAVSDTIDMFTILRAVHEIKISPEALVSNYAHASPSKNIATHVPTAPYDARLRPPEYNFQKEAKYDKPVRGDPRPRMRNMPRQRHEASDVHEEAKYDKPVRGDPRPKMKNLPRQRHEATVQDRINQSRVPTMKNKNPDIPWEETRREKVARRRLEIDGVHLGRNGYHFDEYSGATLAAAIDHETLTGGMHCEACVDPSLPAIMHSVSDNVVIFSYASAPDTRPGYGLILGGTSGITFGHKIFGHDIIATCFRDGKSFPIVWDSHDAAKDLAKFHIADKTCSAFRNIVHHLPTFEDSVHINKTPAFLLSFPKIKDRFVPWMRGFYAQANVTETVESNTYKGIRYTGNLSDYFYSNSTQAGDCGSLLFVADSSTQHKLVGLHIAGSTSRGFATPLFSVLGEDLSSESIDAQEPTPEFNIIGACRCAVTPSEEPEAKDGVLPVAFPLYRDYTPSSSKIIPTVLQETYKDLYNWEIDTEPAVLGIDDPRYTGTESLLWKETVKWTLPKHEIDPSWTPYFVRASNDIGNHMARLFQSRLPSPHVWTKGESINGSTDFTSSKALNFKSSAGYPFTQLTTERGKTGFFEFNPKLDCFSISMSRPEGRYLNACWDRMIKRAKDPRPLTDEDRAIWKCFLKDEPLKLSKIYPEPRTRSVAGAPLDFTCAVRQYFGAAVSGMTELYEVIPPKIGINPQSVDWTMLAKDALTVSSTGTDLDFEGWDFNVPQEIIDHIVNVYNIIYRKCDTKWKPEDDTVRRQLYAHLKDGLILSGGKIWRVIRGIFSGQPDTAPDNCLANWILCLAAYYRLMDEAGEPQMSTFTAWQQNVYLAVYGDDFLATISPAIQHVFNGKTIQQSYAQFGMKATSADKESEITMRPFEDLQFLSRSFVQKGAFWFAPLKERSIRRMLYWHHGRSSRSRQWHIDNKSVIESISSLTDIKNAALPEAYLHGPDLYYKVVTGLEQVFQEKGEPEHFPDFEEAERLWAPWVDCS